LQNSGTSSQEETSASLSPKGPTRKRFALTGVSAPVDPRVDAVRGDLADIRLADRVFAPHYASPMPRALARAVALRAGPKTDSDVVAELAAGETFEVLELAGINAWGVAATPRLVGYIDADALGEAPGA
jgi:hypothetical protein